MEEQNSATWNDKLQGFCSKAAEKTAFLSQTTDDPSELSELPLIGYEKKQTAKQTDTAWKPR